MSDAAERKRRFISTIVEVEGRRETKVVEVPDSEPAPWDESAALEIVGASLPRVDARDKVTGAARYTTDIVRPRMLHAALVRATIPAGRVTAIDLAPALALPNVVDAIAEADLAKPIRVSGAPLFSRRILYVGQPIAAVCAETSAAARLAAAAVRVTCEREPHVVTFDDAVADGAPKVRSSGNISRSSPSVDERGDVERGLAEAAVVIRRTYETPSELHSALEPHGTVAEWEGDRLTLWESTQGVYRVRDEVATALGMPKSHVRVLMDHMGGGFGAKNNPKAHTFTAALLARRTGRPVRCVLDRPGVQSDTGHRPQARMRVTLGARRDGHLTAIIAEGDVTMGVGGWEASTTSIFHELYACPNVRTTDVYAWTHSQAMDSFRAPGHAEGCFALERAMDALARELDMDPLALRLLNHARHDQSHDRPYTTNSLRACLEEGARRFGWATQDARSAAPAATRGSMRRGVGMAAQTWSAGGGPPAYATVRLNPDGTADVLSGTQDLGTGTRTVLAQVAAEALGARVADVRVVLGDTERTPYANNSWGSMTMASVSPAVRAAADDVRRKLLEAAAELLECHPDDVSAANSVVTTRDGARSLTFAEVCGRLGHVMIMANGSRGPNRHDVALVTVGAHFAEVEVDTETGQVRVLRIVAVHEAGRVINPLLAQSQLEGGILMGVGYALFEERVLDRQTGVPLNPGLHEYKIPVMADVPHIDASCLAVADPDANHVGSKGLAEAPVIPAAPAIANAVANALGIEVNTLPLTPHRVLGAIRAAHA